MKDLRAYITESLKIGKSSRYYNYYPQTRDELNDLVKQLIAKRGNKADLNDIDVSHVTKMHFLFAYSEFNGDISKWDVSNVTDMSHMFANSKFNGDISGWDVSKVTDMKFMFAACPLHRNPPKWYK